MKKGPKQNAKALEVGSHLGEEQVSPAPRRRLEAGKNYGTSGVALYGQKHECSGSAGLITGSAACPDAL